MIKFKAVPAIRLLTIAIAWLIGSEPAAADQPPVTAPIVSGLTPDADPGNVCSDPGLTNASEIRDGTAFVGVHACWQADENNQSYQNLNDLYVHWSIKRLESRALNDSPRDYAAEDKPWLVRIFLGRTRSFVSSVRIDMHNPDLTFTIPLASFGYEGKAGKGQSWVTEIVSDDQSQPFFRVLPTTTASVAATANSTQSIDVRATSAVLKAIKGIASVAGPGGPLLTVLNSDIASSLAKKSDDALQNIWAESIDEKQITGRVLSEWFPKSYVLIELVTPKYIKIGQSTTTAVGESKRFYQLALSCPRYSIFLAKQTCFDEQHSTTDPTQNQSMLGFNGRDFQNAVLEARQTVSAEQVLNFPLAPQKTVLSYIAEQTWYQKFLRADASNQQAVPDKTKPSSLTPGSETEGQQNSVEVAAAVGTPLPETDESNAKIKTAPSKPTAGNGERSSEDYASFCTSTVNLLYSSGLSAFDSRLALWSLVTGSLDISTLSKGFQNSAACLRLLPGGPAGRWRYDDGAPPPPPPAVKARKHKG